MADATAEDLYRQDVRIDAAPDVVFEFFVDGEHMLRWMGIDAKLDANPGGEFRVDMNARRRRRRVRRDRPAAPGRLHVRLDRQH